jgi:hypothetical protein
MGMLDTTIGSAGSPSGKLAQLLPQVVDKRGAEGAGLE